MPALSSPSDIPLTLARSATVVSRGRTARVTLASGAEAAPAGAASPHNSVPAVSAAATTLRFVADRTFVKFTFFKLDPAWRRRDAGERARDKAEFQAACDDFAEDRSLRAYSTVGTRGDVDLLLLSQSPILEDIHTFHVVLGQSGLARWASTPYSYLAMTKPSPYSDSESRPEICTSDRRYLFVYPFDKKREWYGLSARGAPADHGQSHRGRPPLPGDLDQHRLLVRHSTTRSSSSPSRATTRASSSTSSRSCGAPNRAPTRCATPRSSPAWRCRPPAHSTLSTAPPPRRLPPLPPSPATTLSRPFDWERTNTRCASRSSALARPASTRPSTSSSTRARTPRSTCSTASRPPTGWSASALRRTIPRSSR